MKNKVPKLRFPEFIGKWEEKKLEDISIKVNLKNKGNRISEVLTNSATHGILAQTDYFDKDIANLNNLDGYYIVNKDDFVYNPRISQNAPVGPISRNNLKIGVMSPLYTVFRFHSENLDYISKYFSSKFWHKYMKGIANYGARHDRMNITNADFFRMSINLPSLPEQEKIANFMSSVDIKIEKLEKKKELLSQYKKGMMQKLFSQKLRFKDENGNDYPEWEEKKLERKVNFIASGKSKIKVENGKYKLYGSTGPIGFVDTIDYEGKYILVARVGANAGTVYKVDDKCGISDNTLVIECKEDVNYIFLYNKIKQYNLNKLIFGSGQPLITGGQLKDLKFCFPSLPEQEKIANFLSLIDRKIELVEEELEKNKEFKKGLLQQMFV